MTDVEHPTGPATGPATGAAIKLGATLRALRRAADLSQRELAARSGVPQATLARIESGNPSPSVGRSAGGSSGRSAGPSFRTIERLVIGAGGQIIVVPPPPDVAPEPVTSGAPEPATGPGAPEPATGPGAPGGGLAAPQEELRDAAGRHCPAHLDAREVREPKDWPGAWWAHWPSLSAGYWTALPAVTYRLDRELRDRDRIRERVRQGFRVRRHLAPELPTTSWRFVAELPDGELVGELRAHERSDELLFGHPVPEQDQIVLDGILVVPAYRRLGIGRRLVNALTAEMARCGVRSAHGFAEGGSTRFLWVCGFRVESMRAAEMRLDLPVNAGLMRRW
ncbi:GNAT family N-acetyltransferase [Micromonospora sp. WMMD1128]|uniref:GNAT family N-acetyltransferase n=1 Tax=Micromonospora sp. WMMD1128 TaxID=3015150 RepID=UPI00248D12B9|nr:GNAT family N-acetyltransferase [Micromonospora sp. WMMD1128]WBB73166.1 GNAT family N-acetyltransferase [Micromonospora sp. WMMD1128]